MALYYLLRCQLEIDVELQLAAFVFGINIIRLPEADGTF